MNLFKYKQFKKPVSNASPNVKVGEPKISKFTVFLIWLLGRLYLFLFFGVAKTILRGDSMIHAFERAMAGKSRCILAFRHPNGGEPQILSIFILFKLKALAAKKGIKFARNPHSVFVYGYEVVRWGGWPARYVMPNLGAMPIHHSKMDSKGMERIYNAITEGPYPVSLAPEGQVSYSVDYIPRLEAGVVRMGFHAAEKLAEKNPGCPVEILPVSIHFRFGVLGKASMETLLRKIEKYCGFGKTLRKLPLKERLGQCREKILSLNEERYNIKNQSPLSFEERLVNVVNAALETAERMLNIKGSGDFFSRLYKVRQICWDRIFLPDKDDFKSIPYFERNLLDLRAGEAWYIARHQELADLGWYFRFPLPDEETSLHNKIEYVQNLYDFMSRSMGGAIGNRKNIVIRKVVIEAAPVINLSERLEDYKKDKKGTIAKSISDLEKAYLNCVEDVNAGESEML